MRRQGYGDLEDRSVAKVNIYKAVRLLVLPASVSAIVLGYFLIWTVSPEGQLEEVLKRVISGVVLTVLGGALFASWIYMSSK